MSDKTKTDRELLELAAKAAGYTVHGSINERFIVNFGEGMRGEWNPLTDDGDAMRLAVKLRITPHIDASLTEAESTCGFCTESHGDDPYSATRRAIVRAAAAIGEGP